MRKMRSAFFIWPACADLFRRAAAHHRTIAHRARRALVRAFARTDGLRMPISIALGLSVLTYLFILSDVDPKIVGLKLFTSIDRFEIMAIPFFILAGKRSYRRRRSAADRGQHRQATGIAEAPLIDADSNLIVCGSRYDAPSTTLRRF
jgi:hypothetical protein